MRKKIKNLLYIINRDTDLKYGIGAIGNSVYKLYRKSKTEPAVFVTKDLKVLYTFIKGLWYGMDDVKCQDKVTVWTEILQTIVDNDGDCDSIDCGDCPIKDRINNCVSIEQILIECEKLLKRNRRA